MKITVINQVATRNSIAQAVKDILDLEGIQTIKFMMAFVNLDGLNLFKDSLEKFYDNEGTIEFIIGLDNGITTYEALKYLRTRFPIAGLYMFQDQSPRIIFHPKIIIAEGKEVTICLIGSANITHGGLYSNFETAIVLEVDNQDKNLTSLLEIWETFKNPRSPLTPAHLKELTDNWLEKNKKKFLPKKAIKREIITSRKSKFNGFGLIKLEPPKPKSKKEAKIKSNQFVSGQQLFLEVLKETGDGGTQVQIPTAAVVSYFKGNLKESKTIRLSIEGGAFRNAYITHFDNNTHRITISELKGIPRNALLHFTQAKASSNDYLCEILTGEDYEKAIIHCTEQTHINSKKWGIL